MMTISKKAYAEFTGRIENVLTSLTGNPEVVKMAIAAVDAYLSDGQLPDSASMPVEVIVAFSMIRPEIDKAAERSRRARERAALRRKNIAEKSKPACETEPAPVSSPKPTSDNTLRSTGSQAHVAKFNSNEWHISEAERIRRLRHYTGERF